ncbi:hypothetical protein [Xanthobacter agilis]|uniref:Uncharacterized protein n=1 Tax=Xanthobacter agilis TaxID=47492 RepID=A0ABU0LDF8_XANAG|nr:hypothetical protein [Xanthobacter agilis]MDQ0505175.1 hypothetical protein [Xanthobacter agilis]
MADFDFVIHQRTGVKRRLMPGDTMRTGEVMYMPMEGMHQSATLKLSDTTVTAFIRNAAGGGKPDDVPAGFFRDGYGRLLPTGTTCGDDRADGKALGFRLAYEADLRDAYKAGDAEPADRSANTTPTIARHGEQEGPEAKKARERYENDMRDAWRQSNPSA